MLKGWNTVHTHFSSQDLSHNSAAVEKANLSILGINTVLSALYGALKGKHAPPVRSLEDSPVDSRTRGLTDGHSSQRLDYPS